MPKSKEYLSDSSDDSSEEMQEVSDSLGGGDEESSLLNNAQEENMVANKNGMREASSREDGEAASESDSDDDINIIIGDIKSIQLEDKPWRQPGRDITNYCNYGFNEVTWRLYCQKRMRSESGEGLILNAGGGGGNPGNMRMPQVAITNDNSKYFGIMGPKRAGPPPKKRKIAGTIDVIGSSGLASRRNLDKSPPKGNVMQVMTADRREYSRKPGFPDMSALPPGAGISPPPPFDMPPPGYAGEPTPFYMPETDPYYQSNQPTQDSQWGNDSTWQPTNLAIPMTEGEDDKDLGPKTIPTMQSGESYFLKVTSYRYSLESLPDRNLRAVTPAFCL